MKDLLLCLLMTCLLEVPSMGQSGQVRNHHTSSGLTESSQLTGRITPTNFYIPGMTMDLTFELELTNLDQEFGDSLAIEFPPSIIPNGSPDDPFPSPLTFGQAGEALNGVSGQVISWGDNDNFAGGIEPLNVIPFTVNVTVMPGTTGGQTVSFFVSGDEYPVNPGPLADTFTIMPASASPMGRLNQHEFSVLGPIGFVSFSDTFRLSNIGLGLLLIDSIRTTNPEFVPNFTADSIAGGDTYEFLIGYDPVDVVDDTDTMRIYTGAGILEVSLFGFAYGNGITLESFEDPVSFPPCPWKVVDADGDGFNWLSYSFAPHSGSLCAATESFVNGVGPVNPDNFLITPQLTPEAGKDFISYWVAAEDPNFPAESYSVVVSTTGSEPVNFTRTEFTETLTSVDWKEIRIDLAAYVGQDIYVGFRHHNVTDEFLMKIDDVRLPPLTDTSLVFAPISLNLRGINEFCEGDSSGSIAAIVTGGGPNLVYNWNTGAATPDLTMVPAGTYTVTISDNCGSRTVTDTLTIGFDNPAEDASFAFDSLVYCKNGSNPVPQIGGTPGGSFSGPVQVVFANAATGEIDLGATAAGGPYQITYTTPGPCFQSAFTQITIDACTSVESLLAQEISLYPNPSNGQVILSNRGEGRIFEVNVFDLNGRSILSSQSWIHRGESLDLDLSSLTGGVYLVQVASGGRVSHAKVVLKGNH